MKCNEQKKGELSLRKESYLLGAAKSSTLMEASLPQPTPASSKTEFLIDMHIHTHSYRIS